MRRTIALILAAACLTVGCAETTITVDKDQEKGQTDITPDDPTPTPDDPTPTPDDPTPTPDDPKPIDNCANIDLQTSVENCGKCGNACGKNQVCTNGVCGCADDYFDCDNNGTCETKGECICHAGESMDCYSGTDATKNVGNCKSGKQYCEVDEEYGADWGYDCVGEVLPYLYPVCNEKNPYGDTDCNGIPDYQQDDDEDGFTACTEFGTSNDCCDSKLVCSSPDKINPGKTADCYGNGIDDDCDGLVDEDETVSCSGSTSTTSCLLSDRTCGNTFGNSVDDSSWSSKVSSNEAALMLAKSMDMCMETVSKASGKAGIIEYSLSKSSSAGPSTNMISSSQVAIINGMANQGGDILIPARVGNNIAMLSSGYAGDAKSVDTSDQSAGGYGDSAPEVYLKQHNHVLSSHSSCGSSSNIHDSVVLHLKLRAPETAKGFSFDFRFFSREYPYYVCTNFNDFFMTIVTDENGKPFIDIDNDGDVTDEDGNISFDKLGNAVSVNNAFFTTCAAPACNDKSAMSNIEKSGCPAVTSCVSGHCGTCEDGYQELYAYYRNPYTGYGDGSSNRGGGTAWLTTTAPVSPGQIFNLDFYIWDTGDMIFDSSVILDNFQWRCNETTVGTDFADPDPDTPIN